MYSFLSALLLPHLPSAALPPHPASTSLPVAGLLLLLLPLSLFQLLSFSSVASCCFFFILLPTSPGSVKGCLWERVSWGQIPHRALDKPPPMAQRKPRRGLRLRIGVTGQPPSRKRQLSPREEGPVRSDNLSVSAPGSWSGFGFTVVWGSDPAPVSTKSAPDPCTPGEGHKRHGEPRVR